MIKGRVIDNWKTTIIGILLIAGGISLLKLTACPDADIKTIAIGMLVTGMGFLGAKDPKSKDTTNTDNTTS